MSQHTDELEQIASEQAPWLDTERKQSQREIDVRAKAASHYAYEAATANIVSALEALVWLDDGDDPYWWKGAPYERITRARIALAKFRSLK